MLYGATLKCACNEVSDKLVNFTLYGDKYHQLCKIHPIQEIVFCCLIKQYLIVVIIFIYYTSDLYQFFIMVKDRIIHYSQKTLKLHNFDNNSNINLCYVCSKHTNSFVSSKTLKMYFLREYNVWSTALKFPNAYYYTHLAFHYDLLINSKVKLHTHQQKQTTWYILYN